MGQIYLLNYVGGRVCAGCSSLARPPRARAEGHEGGRCLPRRGRDQGLGTGTGVSRTAT
jgi:hypothetical protein